MTRKELNRDIKRAYKKYLLLQTSDNETYYKEIEPLKKELRRLYYADKGFEFMNLNSVKIMILLNCKFGFVSLHSFGLNIKDLEL